MGHPARLELIREGFFFVYLASHYNTRGENRGGEKGNPECALYAHFNGGYFGRN